MERLTFQQIVDDKKISSVERNDDLNKLKKWNAEENKRCFYGNKYLYNYQMENLCKVRINNKDSLYDKVIDDSKYKKLYKQMESLNRTGTIANRLFEANRFNNAVVFFKATTAKWLYKKFNAKKVLDPTAGWGGRMLGAWALDLEYTGIDTNKKMIDAYQSMIDDIDDEENTKMKMIFDNCLDVDFSEIEYDFVLTSPPYINLETYECMSPFKTKNAFYEKFLIPLLNKCLKHISNNGWVCFNISPQMYVDLIKSGYRECDREEDLLQQKRLGKNKEDKIYMWRNPPGLNEKTV